MLRQLAKGGASFIIAHASGYNTSAKKLAQQYKVPDDHLRRPDEADQELLSYITTSSQEGAYLAGILAARTTKTHKLGIIISAADPNWYKMSGGFAAGFRSVDKTSKIYFATVSPNGYDDAAGGKRVANSVIAQGADVLFTMGDDASFGYLQAIETAKPGHKVWIIGDIGDMTPIDKKHVFLSSVLWTFTDSSAADQGRQRRHVRHARLQPEPEERRHLAAQVEVHPGRRLDADHRGEGEDHERRRSRFPAATRQAGPEPHQVVLRRRRRGGRGAASATAGRARCQTSQH